MNADTVRRLENIVRFGTIDSVTPSSPFHTVTVSLNGIVTGQLRLLNIRAGKDQTHDLPSKGEECLVLSPSGELAQGVVIIGLNNADFPTISQNPDVVIRMFEDGAVISYDKNSHHLDAILPSGGTATLKADLKIDGKLHVTQDITTDADVKAGFISLKNHKTSGVQSGSSTSGKPIP